MTVFWHLRTMDEIRGARPIPQEKYDLVVWTEYEKLFRDRPRLRNKELAETKVSFTVALYVKLRRSVMGTYLKYFNEGQWQNEFLNFNKLTITETLIENFNQKKKEMFEYNNNLFDEMMTFLKSTITETQEIDCSFLHNHATHLRLDDYSINTVDDGLRHFTNLQFLILCGNWITDIDGSVLPRNLKFLELYANEIESINNLVKKAPKHLLHLGLGRNKLSNDSSLHLLMESGRFSNLKTLDLSECDIYDLKNVLERIAGLQNLDGLLLQGNPCSVVMGYKDIILHNFPNLIYLDGSEITKTDRQLSENYLENADNADLIFQCPELSGLPKPPKAEKKVKQTIHIEVTLPLFQEDASEETDDVVLISNSQKLKKDKSGGSKVKLKESSKSEKKKGKTSRYDKENEYNPKVKNNAFATERKPWSNNLTFSPIVLQSPENNLFAYRDSFRSCVNVRVVYLKFLPPVQKNQSKKEKKKRKEKTKNSKKDKKSEKSKSKQKSDKAKDKKSKSDKSSKTNSEAEREIKKEEPKETILKRVTLVNFYCDLFSINWKDDELNFCWFEEPEFGDKAVEYKSYLEDLRKKEEEKLRLQLEEKRRKEEEQKKEKEKKKDGKISKDKKSKKSNKSNKSKKSTKSKKTKKTKKSKKSKSSKKSKKGKPLSCLVTFGYSRNGKDIKIMQTQVKSKKESKGKKKGKKRN